MISKTYLNRIYLFLIILIATTLPFKVLFNNIAIGLLLIYWLITANYKVKFRLAFGNKYFFLFAAVYLVQFIGILYSEDKADAFSKLEKRAGLLILPFLIMSFPKLTSKQFFSVVIAFTIACCLLFTFALVKLWMINGTIFNVPLITEFIDDTIQLHHAYSGLYLVFSIITLVYFTIEYWTKYRSLIKLVLISGICLLYFFLLMLGARMAIFISFVGLGLLLALFTIQKKNLKSLFALLFITLGGIIGILILPSSRKKLNEFLYLKGVYSPITPRLIQWSCCFDILRDNQAWIQGVGTGDVKPKLQACYEEKKFWGHLYNYNAHNEYLEEMTRHGFLGLTIFLVSLFYPFVVSIKRKHHVYTCFLLIFMFVCISESVLNRQKGVVFFSFFNALLVMQLPMLNSKSNLQLK